MTKQEYDRILAHMNPFGYPTTPDEAERRHKDQKHEANVRRDGGKSWQTCPTPVCVAAREIIAFKEGIEISTCPECNGVGHLVRQLVIT